MKKFLLLLTLFTTSVFAQHKSDIVLDHTCDCLRNSDKPMNTYDELVSALGSCMAPDLVLYYEDLCKEFDLNPKDDLQANMEAIGGNLGVRLSTQCPEFMELMQQFLQSTEDAEEVQSPPAEPEQIFRGKVEKFQSGEFSTLTAGNSDERYKFFWMERFPGSEDYEANPQSLVGKEVVITYIDAYYYDSQSGLYRVKKVIRGITTM